MGKFHHNEQIYHLSIYEAKLTIHAADMATSPLRSSSMPSKPSKMAKQQFKTSINAVYLL